MNEQLIEYRIIYRRVSLSLFIFIIMIAVEPTSITLSAYPPRLMPPIASCVNRRVKPIKTESKIHFFRVFIFIST